MTDTSAASLPFAGVILMAQAVSSGAMCGLIWFVQAVHYPLFAAVTGDRSRDFAEEHQRRTTPVVLPFMLVECVTAAVIAVWPPADVGRPAALAGLALVVVIWLSTFCLQVPLHGRLARDGHTPEVVARLVAGNWIRTIGWTLRAGLAAWMLHVSG